MKHGLILTIAASLALLLALPEKAEAQFLRRRNKAKAEEAVQEQPAEPVLEEEVIEEMTPEEEFEILSGEAIWHEADRLPNDVPPATYDSLIAQWYAQNVVTAYDEFFRDFIDLDSAGVYTSDVPDSVYSNRLKRILSPINLGYNDIVRRYLITYTQTQKQSMRRILGRAHMYFPMIEEELINAGLPVELRMMAVIESALSPVAVSRVGATGLWQFMYSTGKSYGLEITSYVDERRDPVAATRAACRFLKDLYGMYGDWTLAIAAYNCGPGNVNKALSRAGEGAKTFWDVYPYLPRETRGYIPSFIAATYAYTYHQLHDIEPIAVDLPISTDTIKINRLMHLEQVSSTIGTSIETLRAFNPQYKIDIIPATEKEYTLVLPQSDACYYVAAEEEIFAKDTVYLAQYLNSSAAIAQVTASSQTYRIQSGDTLGAIARKYGVTVNQLMQWNNISNPNTLRIGRVIEIHR